MVRNKEPERTNRGKTPFQGRKDDANARVRKRDEQGEYQSLTPGQCPSTLQKVKKKGSTERTKGKVRNKNTKKKKKYKGSDDIKWHARKELTDKERIDWHGARNLLQQTLILEHLKGSCGRQIDETLVKNCSKSRHGNGSPVRPNRNRCVQLHVAGLCCYKDSVYSWWMPVNLEPCQRHWHHRNPDNAQSAVKCVSSCAQRGQLQTGLLSKGELDPSWNHDEVEEYKQTRAIVCQGGPGYHHGPRNARSARLEVLTQPHDVLSTPHGFTIPKRTFAQRPKKRCI